MTLVLKFFCSAIFFPSYKSKRSSTILLLLLIFHSLFCTRMGFQSPSRPLEWVFSLHSDHSDRFNVSAPTIKSVSAWYHLIRMFYAGHQPRYPAEHHKVPVINLPSRSTALTCRHAKTFLVSSILYSTSIILSIGFENFLFEFSVYHHKI